MNPLGTGSGADIFRDLVQKVPANRAGGLDDLAGIVLFLVSKAGAYVLGGALLLMGDELFLQMGRTKLVLNESHGINLIYMSYPIFLSHYATRPQFHGIH